MSISIMSRIWGESAQKSSRLILMLALADYANDEGFCWPGIASLKDRIRMSERQTSRLLEQLEQTPELYRATGDGRGNTSKYLICTGLEAKQITERLVRYFNLPENEAARIAVEIANRKGDKMASFKKENQDGDSGIKDDIFDERMTFSSIKDDISESQKQVDSGVAERVNGQDVVERSVIDPSLDPSLSAPPSVADEFDETFEANPQVQEIQRTNAMKRLESQPVNTLHAYFNDLARELHSPTPDLPMTALPGRWYSSGSDNQQAHFKLDGERDTLCKRHPFLAANALVALPYHLTCCPDCLRFGSELLCPERPPKRKAERKADPVFDAIALGSFNMPKVVNGSGGRIAKLSKGVRECVPEEYRSTLGDDLGKMYAWYKTKYPNLSAPAAPETICKYLAEWRGNQKPCRDDIDKKLGGHYEEREIKPGVFKKVFVKVGGEVIYS